MTQVFVLTTVVDGEVYTTVHSSKGEAYQALAQHVEENWDGEIIGSAYEDFPPDDAREIFFDCMEQHWSVEATEVNLSHNAEEIFLTPAMCDIIKMALGNVLYKSAEKILREHGEAEPGQNRAPGVIDSIFDQL